MGRVVISVDAELGWGFHDRSAPPERRISAARDGWATLVELFDEYEVPATWAVVGHLLREDCEPWDDLEPCPCVQSPVLAERARRYAPELVTAVRDADADHELACHSFSHPGFDDITKERARSEVVRSIAAARAHDITLRSFVFPRNRVGHRDVLAEQGFTAYRGVGPARGGSRLRRLLQTTTGRWTPPLVSPTVDEYGLVDLPDSLYLFRFEGWPRSVVESVSEDPVVRLFRRGVDAAAESDGVFHCWLHPNNVVADRDVRRLREILSVLDSRRDEVTLSTMHEVAERASAPETRPVADAEVGES
ncbi:polysaccharide deacetylase family protein [Haloglomus litoreum]|uniref:polysaccharide deacetylase family protein n=1 Tax=Haloglomus litoreum TaxID=3034026 RepID=UPI0023E8DAE5|nr:polysaccharide deacetylase family protein [Haloglomus sp. DT116]